MSPGSGAPSPAPGISVVVCCHNSATRLPATLAHLQRQEDPGAPWEILVVDNASTDDTHPVSVSTGLSNLRVVAETRLGLSFARMRGLAEAAYPVVIYVDDDNWLEPDYLRVAAAAMRTLPQVGVLGGHLSPFLETTPPEWFARFARYYATGPQAERSGPVPRGWVYGAGLALRRAPVLDLLEHGWRPRLHDTQGPGRTASGGDVELCLALLLSGQQVWFEPALRGRHFIPARRLTWPYVLDLCRANGRARPVIQAYEAAAGLTEPARWWHEVRNTTMSMAKQRTRLGTRNLARAEGDPLAAAYAERRGYLEGLLSTRTSTSELDFELRVLPFSRR